MQYARVGILISATVPLRPQRSQFASHGPLTSSWLWLPPGYALLLPVTCSLGHFFQFSAESRDQTAFPMLCWYFLEYLIGSTVHILAKDLQNGTVKFSGVLFFPMRDWFLMGISGQ